MDTQSVEPRTFRKAERLLKRPQFVQLSKNGTACHARYFLAVYDKSPVLNPRIGITVSRRVGNAVVRNRIKRRVREYFRHHKNGLPGHFDFNVIAKKGADRADVNELIHSLDKLFSRIRREVKS